MCESSAYFVDKQGQEEKIMDYVIDIVPNGDGTLTLVDLLQTSKTINGQLKEVKLLDHKIIIEAIA